MLDFLPALVTPELWQLMFTKVSGLLPVAAALGVLWNIIRRGTALGLLVRVSCSMAVVMIGWWSLLFTFFGFLAAAYN